MVDANKLVAGTSELLRRTIGESVRIETVLAGGLWRTHADVAQLENDKPAAGKGAVGAEKKA